MSDWSPWFRSAKFAGCLLVAVLPLSGCGEDSPTGPSYNPPASLAAVEVVLTPATSPEGYRYAFTVHVTVRELRGVPIVASYRGVTSGTDYNFPIRESFPGPLAIPPSGVGTMDALVEHGSDVPCQTGLDVRVEIQAADGLTASIPTGFNCSTGYWPL